MKDYQKRVVECYVQSYNHFDIDGMTNDLHEEIVFENVSNGQVNLQTSGILDFKHQAIKASKYFHEREQRITAWHNTRDGLAVDIDYTATAATNLPNGIRRGETITLKGRSEFTFKDDQIIQIRDIS